jgi:3-dehydroquinate dehydratase/shikimate dehydrogenase
VCHVPTQIAVPIVAATPPLADQVAQARHAGADLAELRVDRIADRPQVEHLLRSAPSLPVIVTVRSPDEGGNPDQDEAVRRATLLDLARLQPAFLDVELATWQRDAAWRRALTTTLDGTPTQLILSAHDFNATPADLPARMDQLESAGGDCHKLAVTPRDTTDALRLLAALTDRADPGRWIALAMGDAGLCTRVLAGKFGALLTFATLSDAASSAPGQPTLSDLRGRFRWDALQKDSRVLGVVGWPVGHSQGPLIHNAALAAAGMPHVYLPLPVGPEEADLAAFLEYVHAQPVLGVTGLSVTIPHKVHALRWLEHRGFGVSDVPRRCGAVNTLARDAAGGWHGDNTDVLGIRTALADVIPDLRKQRALVLGAGGVARAVVVALQAAGADVVITNRTAARATALAAELGGQTVPWSDRGAACAGASLVVNCTSVGMWPAVAESPLPDTALRASQVICDTIYRPRRTRLLEDGKSRGCQVVTGVAMFIGQAEAQFRCWFDKNAPADVMAAALSAASE